MSRYGMYQQAARVPPGRHFFRFGLFCIDCQTLSIRIERDHVRRERNLQVLTYDEHYFSGAVVSNDRWGSGEQSDRSTIGIQKAPCEKRSEVECEGNVNLFLARRINTQCVPPHAVPRGPGDRLTRRRSKTMDLELDAIQCHPHDSREKLIPRVHLLRRVCSFLLLARVSPVPPNSWFSW